MTKMGVKVAYRSETVEKEVKMARIRPLPGVSRCGSRPMHAKAQTGSVL